jgi:RNA polymerase sigma factor (sigma-70 family)
MSFPDTRITLIQRIAQTNSESDWRQFLNDYWGPVCRFAARRGNLSPNDSEDVASQTFEVLLTNRLLTRWSSQRSAKLRTMLCAVVRNILANRARVQQGRKQLLQQQAQSGGDGVWHAEDATSEQVDVFYAGWVEDLLGQAAEALQTQLHQEGKGDYFRVLYGRVCEGLKMKEISDALDIKIASAENYFKSARKRLADQIQNSVRQHVSRYCAADEVQEEFRGEWNQLTEYVRKHGGLESALKLAYELEICGPDRISCREAWIQQSLTHAISRKT